MFSKCHIFVIKIKRNFFAILFMIFAICLLLFSKNNLTAVKNGLTLWATSVVPSLFPFFITTELLLHTNIIHFLGRLLNKFMKPLFNIRGEGSFGLIMGIISGYPVGAKIACDFREKNICTKSECERLLSFTNNSGPLFIVGTVGISMFGNTLIGVLLLITHILASITVGIIFRFWDSKNDTKKKKKKNFSNTSHNENVNISNLGQILSESITRSLSTIFMIGGFIIIFSSIISILKSSGILNILSGFIKPVFNMFSIDTSLASPFITGVLEITNGISQICSINLKNISINIIFCAFLLGFGGISVLLQVLSITSKTDLSIKPYIYGKLLHGVIAAFYTFLFINFIPIFNLDL